MSLNLIGQTLGKYHILEEIGRGGMGVVYKAHDTVLERLVAIKVLAPHLTWDKEFVQRFLHEARSAARIEHPHIVTIYDVAQAQGHHFIAMKYLEGRSLAEIIRREGPLPMERAVRILDQIAQALDYAHARNLIHRDVKPGNVIVGPQDHATLTDFGVAKALAGTRLTQSGVMVGTPAYMSPEQVKQQRMGSATDVYSLGVVAYEMLGGRPPFEGDTPHVLYAHVYEEPRPLSQMNPKVSPAVGVVVQKALAKEPDKRYGSAGAFVAALGQAVGSRETEVIRKPPPPRRPSPPKGRVQIPMWPLFGGLLAVMVVMVMVFWAVMKSKWPPPTQTPVVQTTATETATPTATPTTPTPTTTPETPTSTLTAAPTPIPTFTLTPTPQPKATPTATKVPTQTPTPTPSITLLKPNKGSQLSGWVTCEWTWTGTWGPGQTFDVKVCKGGGCEPQFGKTITWGTTWEWCPDEGEGIYRWKVEAIDDRTKQPKGPTSEVREFRWVGTRREVCDTCTDPVTGQTYECNCRIECYSSVITLFKPSNGATVSGLVTFDWTWPGMLASGEVFDVKVCKGEACLPQFGIINTRGTTTPWPWCPNTGVGVYRWQVVVIDSVTMQSIGPASEVWEFTWEGGCGLPTKPPPPPLPPTDTPVPTIALLKPANGVSLSGLVTFEWAWTGMLGPDEVFDVKVCKGEGCQPQFGITNTRDTTWVWCPDNGGGIYRWKVEGIDEVTKQPKGPRSEVWEFTWTGGCGPPPETPVKPTVPPIH